jgi:acetoin utilization deacetylase AcuC-like enzyme
MLRTALISDRRFLKHFAGRSHPERPERAAVMIEMADDLHRPGILALSPREARTEELELCHDPAYIAEVKRSASMPHYDFDGDTHASPDSYQTALLAAGGVLTAVEAVMDGAADNAFAIVRPPGHHALAMRAMGFCLFNNVAIAARYLIRHRGLKRVLVVDWDVHHGNGIQDIFYESPEVLYFSTHQFPFYPGTGTLDEIGYGAGAGYTVNAPMPASFGDDEYLRVFDDLLAPVVRQFRPEFILVSSGFDAHFRDPLGGMRVTEDGFTALARRVKRMAAEHCGGRMVAALEGGYDLQALAASGRSVIEELGREADEPLAPAGDGARVSPIVERSQYFLAHYWKF